MDPNMQPGRPPGVTSTARLARQPRLAHQVVGGKAVILDYEGRKMLGLNDTGSVIWSLIDGRRTVEQITVEVAGRAGVGPDEVRADVCAFLDGLLERGLVVDPGSQGSELP